MSSIDDPRVRTGLERQLTSRRDRLDGGAQAIGWKAGYGTKPVLESLSLAGPLVGFMTDASLLEDGAAIDISGMIGPAIEAEIAVRLRTDIEPGSTPDQVADAIDAIAPAIEVVDFDGTERSDVEEVLARNIFHRYVVLGTWDEGRAGLDLEGVTLDVQAGETALSGVGPTDVLGDLVEVVRWLADLVAGAGERLRAGEIVITGSAIVPAQLQSGDAVSVRYNGLGEVGLRVT